MQRGRRDLGPESFEKWMATIEEFVLDVELIVFGYEDMIYVQTPDAYRFRHIFTVFNPGVAVNREADGFAVIGSGYKPALTALTVPFGLCADSIGNLVYLLCEAKFLAEGSLGVRGCNVGSCVRAER